MAERLKFRRKQLRLSGAEVGRRVRAVLGNDEFTQQAYQALESGRSRSSKYIIEICNVLDAELAWVKDGKGPIPNPPDHASDEAPLLLTARPGLEPLNNRVILEADVRSGAGSGGVRHSENVVSDQNGNTFTQEGIAGEWTLPQPVMSGMLHASPQNIRVFEVIGDSMEPRLKSGDRVFVDMRLKQPNPEGIFVLWDGYSIVVKQLQIVRGSDPLKLRVISANQQYEPYEVLADEVNIIGRFIGRFTTD